MSIANPALSGSSHSSRRRADEALTLVHRHPGITLQELAKRMKIKVLSRRKVEPSRGGDDHPANLSPHRGQRRVPTRLLLDHGDLQFLHTDWAAVMGCRDQRVDQSTRKLSVAVATARMQARQCIRRYVLLRYWQAVQTRQFWGWQTDPATPVLLGLLARPLPRINHARARSSSPLRRDETLRRTDAAPQH